MGSTSASIIQQLVAKAKQLGRPKGLCPCCAQEGYNFKRHDQRERNLRLIVEGFVVTCVIVLIRWKCRECLTTFTHYPDFIVPNKHYFFGDLCVLATEYLEQGDTSYRSVVAPQGEPIGYAERKDGSIDERQLSHNTIWRCLSHLGSLPELGKRGLELIQQKVPQIDFHRQPLGIQPWKYRSPERETILQQALRFLRMASIFHHIFTRVIFPTFSNFKILLAL